MAKKPDLRVLGLGDASLLERLGKAAKAAGVETVEQLVDLVVDSGVSARPPVDPYTERFTLEELGERLWIAATTTQRTRRREWFRGLVPVQRAAIVTTLRHRGYASHAISNDFGIPELEVEEIYAEHTTKLGSQVLGVRLDTLAGQLAQAKQRAQQLASERGDAGSFWRIEKEFIGVLQDLGVIERAAHRVEVVKVAEGKKQAALDRINTLAEKRAARLEEIKRAEFEIVEPEALPEDVAAHYEELRDGG